MKRFVRPFALLPLLAAGLLAAQTQIIDIRNTQEVFRLFEKLDYTMQAWEEGIRVVPRIYLTTVPEGWRERAQTLPVEKKKALFFRLLAPAVLHANERVLRQRKQLTLLAAKARFEPGEKAWLTELSGHYGLREEAADGVDAALLAELLLRVDAVPVSLALAQSADESGWGTSRFAEEGNALFGQWEFGGKGMAPEDRRKKLGDYGLARFKTPQDAVYAYLLNLNTTTAYAGFRRMRAQMRADGQPLSGYKLAETLLHYSERGQAYVDNLRGIIDTNGLRATDAAYLWDKGDILLVPVPSH